MQGTASENNRKTPVRVNRSINVRFLKWDRLPACHFQCDRLEAYPTRVVVASFMEEKSLIKGLWQWTILYCLAYK